MEGKYAKYIVGREHLPEIKMDVAGEKVKYSSQASTPLFLESCKIHVSVKAATVQTTHFLTFLNTTDKVLSGELVFPLPKSSSVHGYGLDVNGVLVDAVPVEKEKARVAFETTVREKGPAVSVAEKVSAGSNVFKTKVYPMPPNNGRRTVKIVVMTPVIDSPEEMMTYLSLTKPAGLKELTYSFETSDDMMESSVVLVRRSSGMMEPIDPQKINSNEDIEGILLVVPKSAAEKYAPIINVEKDPDSGYHYFSATFGGLGDVLQGKRIEKIENKISVFYDVSSSRKDSQWKQELKYLYQFLERYEKVSGKIEVEVTTFSCEVHEKRTFQEKMELMKFLTSQRFDGGTCLPLEEISSCEESQFVFLFTDGISNFGMDMETKLFSGLKFLRPIFCFSSAPKSSYLILRYLGNISGGGYFDLSEESVESVVEKTSFEQVTLKRVICEPKGAVEEIFHSEVVNNAITIFGKVIHPEKEATIELDFGVDCGRVFKTQIPLRVFSGGEEKSRLLRTLWAQEKIRRLSIFPSKNKNLIQELGIKYGIVTEHTSLIVLSELSQYQKHKIVPPKCLKEMRKAYMFDVQEKETEEEKRKLEKLEKVYLKWASRVKWHQRDFKKEIEEEIRKKKEEVERRKRLEEERKLREEEERKRREEERKKRAEEERKAEEEKKEREEALEKRMKELLESTEEMQKKEEETKERLEKSTDESEKELIQKELEEYKKAKEERLEEVKKQLDMQRRIIEGRRSEGARFSRMSESCCCCNCDAEPEIQQQCCRRCCRRSAAPSQRRFRNLGSCVGSSRSCSSGRGGGRGALFGSASTCSPMMNMCCGAMPDSSDGDSDEEADFSEDGDICSFGCDSFDDVDSPSDLDLNCCLRSCESMYSAPKKKAKRITISGPKSFDMPQPQPQVSTGAGLPPRQPPRPTEEEGEGEPEESIVTESVIKVKAFKPGEEYLKRIKEAKEDPYLEYLHQKEKYEDSPSFYLDCSDYFLSLYSEKVRIGGKGDVELALGIRILSNVAELELNNIQLFRIVGYRLDQAKKYDEAIFMFEKVLEEKPEEPQSYRDLALVLEKKGIDLARATEFLWKCVTMKVDSRFDEIELTAATELNHVLKSIKEEERLELIKKLQIDERFVYNMDVDIRISMAWDTDMTDIDLHVYDPDNEHCYYQNKETKAGGFISRDFVRGYGPEEFLQKQVFRTGKFKISAKYYASHQQSLTGGTTVLLSFFTNYMRENEKFDMITLRLTENKEEIEVCEIEFEVKEGEEFFVKELLESVPSAFASEDLEKYKTQMETLKSMGFTDESLNMDLLKQHNGNVENCLATLLGGAF